MASNYTTNVIGFLEVFMQKSPANDVNQIENSLIHSDDMKEVKSNSSYLSPNITGNNNNDRLTYVYFFHSS